MLKEKNNKLIKQEKFLLRFLNKEQTDKYNELRNGNLLNLDGKAEYELSELMRIAISNHMLKEDMPLCQWKAFSLRLPLQHWLKASSDLGFIKGKLSYLLEIESPDKWNIIKKGLEDLIKSNHSVEAIERLAFLYTKESLMGSPQVVPELDYKKANQLLLFGIELGADWLYNNILSNYDTMIKKGISSEEDKQIFIKKVKPLLKYEKVSIPIPYEKLIKKICNKLEIECIDSVNIHSAIIHLHCNFSRFISDDGKSRKEYIQIIEYLGQYLQNKIQDILI